MAENSTCSSASSCTKSSCEGCPSKQTPQSFQVEMNAFSDIKHVIGIVSGKGGVGKSMVTASLANQLDYLLVDMPPGTGDVPLTVFQSLPVDGIVIVSSPQDLVRMIVKKAYNMALTMNIPVLGIVENYSYLSCPDCGKKILVFGESHIDEIAKELGTKVLGKMPIDPEFAHMADGSFAQAVNPHIDAAVMALRNI